MKLVCVFLAKRFTANQPVDMMGYHHRNILFEQGCLVSFQIRQRNKKVSVTDSSLVIADPNVKPYLVFHMPPYMLADRSNLPSTDNETLFVWHGHTEYWIWRTLDLKSGELRLLRLSDRDRKVIYDFAVSVLKKLTVATDEPQLREHF
jgi:hypothetical protein